VSGFNAFRSIEKVGLISKCTIQSGSLIGVGTIQRARLIGKCGVERGREGRKEEK
jgi:hypothetical protein